jgi:peptidoglycan hydrolase-like protein with peptidoglycan-binding domain
MKFQIIALAALASLSLVTTAFAGNVAAPPKPAKTTAAATSHTPMTPAQTHALWQAAQTKLKADHLYNGPINGQPTDQTMAAIRTFQSLHDLTQTGRLDQPTRQALGI